MADQSPLLSICIPAYNRPDWFQRSLKSILATPRTEQTQVEVIVSDDSTNAECKVIFKDLIADWQGFYAFQSNSPSLGMAANWNHCIEMASGEYVLILHDDDYLELRAIVEILQALRKNLKYAALLFGVNVVNAQQQILKRQSVKSQTYLNQKEALRQVLSNSSFVRFPGMVVRRKAFDEVGYFDEAIGGIADIDMWVRLFHQFGLLRVPIITVNYTVHSSALTMNMFNSEVVEALEKLFSRVSSHNWLTIDDLEQCKANYFHQFILAGSVRYIKVWNLKRAREILSLFNQVTLDSKKAAPKWQVIRIFVKVFLFLSKYFTSGQRSSGA